MIRSLPDHVTHQPDVTLPNHKLLYISQLPCLLQGTYFSESTNISLTGTLLSVSIIHCVF